MRSKVGTAILILFFILLSFKIFDLVSTWMIVCEQEGFFEANPVSVRQIQSFGFVPIAAWQLLPIVSIIPMYILYSKLKKNRWIGLGTVFILSSIAVSYVFVLVNNSVDLHDSITDSYTSVPIVDQINQIQISSATTLDSAISSAIGNSPTVQFEKEKFCRLW